MNYSDSVILVDSLDNEIGYAEKMDVHVSGQMHRAVSIFIFNSQGEWLIQKRALHKYHSAGLWSNTCCTHPFPGESIEEAANRRLFEEMGLQVSLIKVHEFTYNIQLQNGLIENEYDHVFIGYCNENPILNPEEVCDYKYVSFNHIQELLSNKNNSLTVWFKLLIPIVKTLIK